MIDHFDPRYVEEAALQGAMAGLSDFEARLFGEITSWSQLAKFMLERGVANLLMQLVEMKIGMRDQLDYDEVGAQMAIALVDKGFDFALRYTEKGKKILKNPVNRIIIGGAESMLNIFHIYKKKFQYLKQYV